MAITVRHNGFASTGPTLLTGDPYVSSDSVIWVDSVTGSDSNAGTEQRYPKATVFGASGAISVCTSSNSNMVLCLKTHRETVSAYTWSTNGVTLISLGSGSDRAQFTCSGIIQVTATEARVENCYFPVNSSSIARKFSVDAAGFEMRDCYLLSGANDATAIVRVNAAAHATFRGCSFVVSAEASGTTRVGLLATGASTNLLVEDCTFDGGSFGWSSGYALNIDTATADRFRLRNLTLSNYSFAGASISGVKGYIGGDHVIDSTSGWRWAE